MAAAPLWSTSSDGAAADTKPLELSALGEHLAMCNGDGARRVAMHCGAKWLQGFVMSRLVSVLALIVAVTGGVLLLL